MPDRLLELPDDEIVARIRDGDVAVYRKMFLAYQPPLARFAYRYVRSPELAEEIVADVLLRVWERRREWKIAHTVESYLYAAVRNRALNELRRSKRNDEVIESAAAELRDLGELERDAPPLGMSQPDTSIDARLADADRNALIWHAVASLSERSRLVLTLRWQQHMEFAEIAEVLETTVSAVEQQHSRAIRALRQMLPNFLK